MKKILTTMIFVLGLILAVNIEAAPKNPKEKSSFWAVSDGKGTISLFWLPEDKFPEGGWRLERIMSGKSNVIAQNLAPAVNTEALNKLDPKEAQIVKTLAERAKQGIINKEDLIRIRIFLGIKASENPVLAEALGMSYKDKDGMPGKRNYRLLALDKGGKVFKIFETKPLDPNEASSSPLSPSNCKAEATDEGVRLMWQRASKEQIVPIVAYHIERQGSDGSIEILTPKPLIAAKGKAEDSFSFLDVNVPKEMEVTYRVSSVDIFGWKSEAVSVKLYVPDREALYPPTDFIAIEGKNRIELKWKPKKNSLTAGYIIERSYLHDGPYEIITPKMLSVDYYKYDDNTVIGGTAYFYRIRSVGQRGDLGSPSRVMMAQPSSDNPPKPEGLKADVGRTRIRLTWNPVKFPVAGYFIERRASGSEKWSRLNGRLVPETLYDDELGQQNSGRISYRVIAVSFDSLESKPSETVEVTLRDTIPPPSPIINSIIGDNGRVTIEFEPSIPEEDSFQFIVLRSASAEDTGIVISEPLSTDKRKFEDIMVEPGNDYWYRLVAIDRAGNRSELSKPVRVGVSAPEIPKPEKPSVRLIKEPYPHAEIKFNKSPEGFAIVVQVKRAENLPWVVLAGPITDSKEVIDTSLSSKGKISYRIVYRLSNGLESLPSEAVEVLAP
ncbi:hypothetical protein [Thermodesulfovibrio sp.]|uniref:fibronectin type III domain-containing protein n=1 Tax=Thermodesulfovibrio sp. TaxID=2067987 RepID=UPI0030A2536B